MSTASSSALFRRLLPYVRPYWCSVTIIFFLDLLVTPLALLGPVPLKIAVDTVIGSEPLPAFLDHLLPAAMLASPMALLGFAAGLQVAIVILSQLRELGSYVLYARTGEGMTLRFREQLFRHVQRLAFSFHDKRGTADTIYRIQYDAPAIRWMTVDSVIPLVISILTVLSMIYIMARLDWQLALVALVVLPALLMFLHVYNRRMRGRYEAVKEMESRMLRLLQEVLTALRVVKAFRRESHEQARFVSRASDGVRGRTHLAVAEAAFGLVVSVTTAVGTALVLYVGIRSVVFGRLSLGELLIVLAYVTQLYEPLQTISKKLADMQWSRVSMRRAFELQDEVIEVAERPHPQPVERSQGAIAFRDVSFTYDGDRLILDHISFAMDPGTRLGIEGKSGSGKSTLMSLLTRFYDPTDGQILLDGVDLRDYRLSDLRNQFAIVLQEPVLFSTSIAENIAYGRPDAGYQDIVEAAKAAHAHDFIVRFAQGYDTEVGERGMQLSAGERQRIALARAFLKDAPILILDEPTSSIDEGTEAAIMDVLDRLMYQRTALMITHHPSTLDVCNARIEVEYGCIIRSLGSVDALLSRPVNGSAG